MVIDADIGLSHWYLLLLQNIIYMKTLVFGALIIMALGFKKGETKQDEAVEFKGKTVEFATITLKDGITEEMLLKASHDLQNDFLIKQPGFLKRELLKRSSKEYVDLIYWENQESADKAFVIAMENPVCLSFFELMEAADINDPAEGVAYYKVINEYE